MQEEAGGDWKTLLKPLGELKIDDDALEQVTYHKLHTIFWCLLVALVYTQELLTFACFVRLRSLTTLSGLIDQAPFFEALDIATKDRFS